MRSLQIKFYRNVLIASFAGCIACSNLFAESDSFDRLEAVAGKQVELSWTPDGDAAIEYLMYLPADYNQQADKQWPLVLFLHGRGESFGPLSIVAKWGPPKFAQRDDKLPFILVSPQCPKEGFWNDKQRQTALDKLLKHVESKYRVNQRKISVTGLSMGGYGAWQLAVNFPRRFSCIVPICGAGNVADAKKLVDTPVWAFHGTNDEVVPLDQTSNMVEAIKSAGGRKIRFTTLEHVGHNSWSSAYALPDLFNWMLAQSTPE